jgi:hypothetical protein
VETLLGCITLTQPQILQLQLPCNHGGAGLTPVQSIAHFAPIASYVQTTLPVCQWLWNFGETWETISQNIDTTACDLSLDYLSQRGIYLDCNAQPQTKLTQHNFSSLPPPDYATSKMQGKYSNALAEKQIDTLIDLVCDNKSKARLRSCGGVGGGDFLMAMPSNQDNTFDNIEFQTSMRWRLGLPIHSKGMVCARHTLKRGQCNALMEETGDHAVMCGVGGINIKRHNWLRDLLAHACQAAQLHTLTEQYIPELTKWCEEKRNP